MPKKQCSTKNLMKKKDKQKRLNTEHTITSYLLTKSNSRDSEKIKNCVFSPLNNVSFKID